MTPRQAKRQRAELMRAIARELKAKNRARLVSLRAQVRAERAKARAAIGEAIARCRQARKLPTVKELARDLRSAKAAARLQCDVDLKAARAIKDAAERARAELAAEQKYQRDLRRIEAGQRRKLKESTARARRPRAASLQESDDAVRGNIPTELVPLWEKVKRGIKGSDRRTRTEAFLEYAEESPGEDWAALEDAADRAIAEMERRQSMPNPKNPKRLTAAQSRKRFEALKKAGCKPKRVRLGGESVVIRRKACKAPRFEKNCPNPRRAPGRGHPGRRRGAARRRPPGRWWDACLHSVEGRRYARDPAAVCGAAWWRMPATERRAIVRKMQRGAPRERRAAVAIAKAERNRADGPRRKNGAMGDVAARREYTRTHWGRQGRRQVRADAAANPAHGTAVELGTLRAVHYETKKGSDGKITIYEHEFEGRRPVLLYNEGGLVVAGGQYVVSSHGIEG
jgi:hypothetical protein